MNEDTLYDQALATPAEKRAAYLEQACAGDPAMRRRIDALLEAHRLAGNFLDAPLVPRLPEVAEESPGDRIGRYTLVGKIGEGGCGTVWRAEQQEPVRRHVALKVIKLGMDTREVVARFEAERQALALMEHPNIARVFDGGATETGRPFFVMELVRGVSITAYCDRHHLSTRERIALFLAVCQAIQHAHQKGVIHRDLKPSNILVTVNDGAAVPKVIDFGIAKATHGRLTDRTLVTGFHQLIGTPAYMSPEQVELGSVDVDTRSDIYSLGVLLYELLAGETPFDRRSLTAAGVDGMRQCIRTVDPPRPSTRFRTLDDESRTTVARLRGTAPAHLAVLLRGDLDWIVLRCLEKDRARRYETANALAMDLRRHLNHEPVVARPPSAAYVLRKLVRRHRLAVGAAAAVAATLLVGSATSTWQAIRATRAEREQSRLRQTAEEARVAESRLRTAAEAQELAARRRAYAGDMLLIQQALAANQLGRAQDLLNRQRPQSNEADLRGWEWRYLWQFCQSDATGVIATRPVPIHSLSVSPDGDWLAAGGGDGQVWLRNLASGHETNVRVGGGSTRVGFVPHRGLLGILYEARLSRPVEERMGLRLWNPLSGQIEAQWALGGTVFGLFFAPDGRRLATSTLRDDAVTTEIWQIPGAGKLAGWPIEAAAMVPWGTRFAVSPDFTIAAHAGNVRPNGFGALILLDLATGRQRIIENAVEERLWALEFSPDGRTLATNGSVVNPAIRLWDVAAGREIGRLEGHSDVVKKFVFTPDGRTLFSSGEDMTIRLWDLERRRLLHTFRGHQQNVGALALLADGRTLVSGGQDGRIMTWDVTPDKKPRPDYFRINDSGLFGKMQVYNDAVVGAVGTNRPPAGGQANGTAARPAAQLDSNMGIRVVSNNIERWSGPEFRTREVLLELGSATIVALSGSNTLIASTRSAGQIELWDWQTRTLMGTLAVSARRTTQGVFADQGRRLLAACEGDDNRWTVREWELSTGAERRRWNLQHESSGMMSVSPDSRFCVIARPTVVSDVIDRETGEQYAEQLDFAIGSMAGFSPDSRWVPVARPEQVQFWNLAERRFERTIPLGANSGSRALTFSTDGTRLVVGHGGREAVTLWDVAGTQRVLSLAAPASIFTSLQISPDGNVIAARSQYGQLFAWRAPSWAEIAAAETNERKEAGR